MDKFINNQESMVELFDDAEPVERAGEIGAAILEVRSLRLEETYRDLKSLLGLTRLMNKQQVYYGENGQSVVTGFRL
ncbi:MAG: hypothetical protein AB1453_02320 [Chloroflexota bacterium]|jgi:hypothetical protein